LNIFFNCGIKRPYPNDCFLVQNLHTTFWQTKKKKEKTRKKLFSCNHRAKHQGFTFLAKMTKIGNKNKTVKKGGPVSSGITSSLDVPSLLRCVPMIRGREINS
jgi:hypothetical protein